MLRGEEVRLLEHRVEGIGLPLRRGETRVRRTLLLLFLLLHTPEARRSVGPHLHRLLEEATVEIRCHLHRPCRVGHLAHPKGLQRPSDLQPVEGYYVAQWIGLLCLLQGRQQRVTGHGPLGQRLRLLARRDTGLRQPGDASSWNRRHRAHAVPEPFRPHLEERLERHLWTRARDAHHSTASSRIRHNSFLLSQLRFLRCVITLYPFSPHFIPRMDSRTERSS